MANVMLLMAWGFLNCLRLYIKKSEEPHELIIEASSSRLRL